MSFDHNTDHLIDALNAVLRACDDAESAVDEYGSSIESIFKVLGFIRVSTRTALIELEMARDLVATND